MKLSLIVATYNRADKLMPTLQSIVGQSVDPSIWEAVIVNNNSKDNTSQIVEEFISHHPNHNIKLLNEPRQGLSHARNCGIEGSSAPLIAIIDDDEEVVSSYIQSYIEFFEMHPEVAAAGGAITPKYEGDSRPKWLTHWSEVPIANPIKEVSTPRPFAKGRIPGGGNMAIRRSAIVKYGSFDPELGRCGESLIGGEESNLFDRLRRGGEQVWFVPRAEIYHNIAPSKLQRDYLDRLWYNIGVSQATRARIEGVASGVVALREVFKWGVTLLLALYYIVTLRPSKGWYLCLMRRNISRGIFGRR